MTSLESLLCNSCGAPLKVPQAANYIKCNHCHTQLHIRRDEGVTFTESIEQLNQTAKALQQHVDRLTAQQQMSDLDRQWEQRKEDFMVTGQHGHKSLPTKGGAMVGGVIVAAFGLIWTVMAFGITASSPFPGTFLFPLFGLLFVGGGIYNAISAANKAHEYERAHAEYRRERSRLKQQPTSQNPETDHE
ncbi:zinc finger domain-containing protein [Neorhodopirellula pilleata]|uniref:Uncharacterized protein n=1 Tax=Neorhodopirellula pilleata TaxID=2714738 RepID=A0A5C6AXW4_9BACT|nr:hypothetical protein [Neorhodopirellula pilleata]TWU04019.1 hypothetical protein Pla100_09550 [Neorhodopirellula pilleata]